MERVERMSDADVKACIRNILASINMDMSELMVQATAGQFKTDRARRAWFCIAAFVGPPAEVVDGS